MKHCPQCGNKVRPVAFLDGNNHDHGHGDYHHCIHKQCSKRGNCYHAKDLYVLVQTNEPNTDTKNPNSEQTPILEILAIELVHQIPHATNYKYYKSNHSIIDWDLQAIQTGYRIKRIHLTPENATLYTTTGATKYHYDDPEFPQNLIDQANK